MHTCANTHVLFRLLSHSQPHAHCLFAGYIVTATTLMRSQLSLSVSTFVFCVFFQDHCPKGSYGQNASHQLSLSFSSEQQGFHVAAWNKDPQLPRKREGRAETLGTWQTQGLGGHWAGCWSAMAAAAETACPSSWAGESKSLGNCISRKKTHWNSSTRASNQDMWMLLHWQDDSKWKRCKKDTISNWRSRERDLPTGIKYKKWDCNERPFNKYPHMKYGCPGGSDGKESACNAADLGLIPESGGFPEKGNATNSSILAWRIPWTEEPGVLQSMGLPRVGIQLSD